jgi:hypothetical protein
MKRVVLRLGFISAIALLAATQGLACGDKVLALGRAIKLRYVTSRSSSILVYAHAGSPAAGAMLDTKLQSALKQSSQSVKIVSSPADMEEALEHGKYDLVLTDTSDAAATEQKLQAVYSHTVVVPVLNEGTKTEASSLAKRYHVVLKTPGKSGAYLSVLDEAMEMKAKRDETKELVKK